MAKNAGVLIGLVVFVLSGLMFVESFSLDYFGGNIPGPGLFPRWLGGCLMVLSVLFIVDSARKGGMPVRDLLPRGTGLKKVAAVFLALVVFLVLVPFIGYTLASLLMLLILFLSSEYNWYVSLALAAGVSGTVFYIFKYILSVPLPVNIFGI